MIQATTGRYNHRNAAINLTYGCDKDNNTYAYRMIGGNKVFSRVQLGPGWQNQRFSPNCEILKGDGEMVHKTGPHDSWLNWGELMPQVEKLMGEGGMNAQDAAIKLGIKPNTLQKKLNLDRKQRDQAQAEPGGDQPDPAQNDSESAETIIPKREHFEGDCPKCGTKPYGIKGDIKLIKWIADNGEEMCYECYLKTLTEDKPEPTYTAPLMGSYEIKGPDEFKIKPLTFEGTFFNPETPLEELRNKYATAQHEHEAEIKARIYPLTSGMLDTMLEERQSALSHYCERQAVESLRQQWAADIFKHNTLSREKKLELIGKMLDLEVE